MKILKAAIIISTIIQLPSTVQCKVTAEANVREYTHDNSPLTDHRQQGQVKGQPPPSVRGGRHNHFHPHTASHHVGLDDNFFTLPDADQAALQYAQSKSSKKQSVQHDWMISPSGPRHSSKRGRTSRSSSHHEPAEKSFRNKDVSRPKPVIGKRQVVPVAVSTITAPSTSFTSSSSSSSSSSGSLRSSFDFSRAEE